MLSENQEMLLEYQEIFSEYQEMFSEGQEMLSEDQEMLSEKRIDELHGKIDLDIVKEGVRQAEERLKDALERNRALDQRLTALLNLCMISSITIFSGFIAIFSGLEFLLLEKYYFISILILLFFSGLSFILGAILSMVALTAFDYGIVGRYPKTWLEEQTIKGDSKTLATILAYILHDYQKRIEVSEESNSEKVKLFNKALRSSIVGVLLFLVAIFIIMASPALSYFFCN